MAGIKHHIVKVNQIFLDILNWIKSHLRKQSDNKNNAYGVLSYTKGNNGLLKLVERNTPRAIRTYILTPLSKKEKDDHSLVAKAVEDIHLYLDTLGALDTNYVYDRSVNRAALSKEYSHCITILKASRWLDKDGNYYTKPLFCEYYDFFPRSSGKHRDTYAVPIITEVANLLKNEHNINAFDFKWEINTSQKRFMGGDYREKIENNKITKPKIDTVKGIILKDISEKAPAPKSTDLIVKKDTTS